MGSLPSLPHCLCPCPRCCRCGAHPQPPAQCRCADGSRWPRATGSGDSRCFKGTVPWSHEAGVLDTLGQGLVAAARPSFGGPRWGPGASGSVRTTFKNRPGRGQVEEEREPAAPPPAVSWVAVAIQRQHCGHQGLPMRQSPPERLGDRGTSPGTPYSLPQPRPCPRPPHGASCAGTEGPESSALPPSPTGPLSLRCSPG